MKKRLFALLLAAALPCLAFPEVLEYFWNTDPGLGKGTQIDVDEPVENRLFDSVEITAPTVPGDYRLYVRILQKDGTWGNTYPPVHYKIAKDYAPEHITSIGYQFRNSDGKIVRSFPIIYAPTIGSAKLVSATVDTGFLDLPPDDYTIEIIATNSGGVTTRKQHPISITGPSNQAPVLRFYEPPSLEAVNSGDASPDGTLVSAIIAQLLPKQAYDADDDILGIGIGELDFSHGDWQYLTPANSKWLPIEIPPKGYVFLLGETDRIRFLPDSDAPTALPKGFTFKLWDQSQSSPNKELEIQSKEGISSLSSSTGYASAVVIHPEEAPVYVGESDFEIPNTGGALRLDLAKLFKTRKEEGLLYKLEEIEKPELFSKYGIDQKNAELLLYPILGKSGSSGFAVSATDSQKRKTTADLSVDVVSKNLAPEIEQLPTIKLTETNLSESLKLSQFVSNPEGTEDPLSYTLIAKPSDLWKTISVNRQTGELSVTAADKQQGSAKVSIVVTDTAGNRASATLLISVATNPPVDVSDPAFSKSLDLEIEQTVPKFGSNNPISFSFRGDLGATYELQKSSNLKTWNAEESITISDTAKKGVLSGELKPADSSAFWRIVKTANGVPLGVSEIIATYDTNAGLDGILLQIQSTSRELVDSVVFYDGSVVLGDAVELPNQRWAFTVQYDSRDPRTAEIYAIADGAEGNQTVSATTRLLLADPAQFAALDEFGQPVFGSLIQVNDDGTLPAFRFYPLGSPPSNPVLWFEFPAGTELDWIEGRKHIVFESGTLHVAAALGEPVPLPAGALPIGVLQFAQLEELLGDAVSGGLPLVFNGNQAILWTGGPLPNTQFSPSEPPQFELISNTPSPEFTNTNATPNQPNNESATAYQQTWYGEFHLPGTDIRLTAIAQNPLWLTLYADGSFQLKGAVQIDLPNGASFSGSLHFAHPRYSIQIGAESVEIPALGSLVELLPANAESCLPNTPTPNNEELSQLQACLDAYRKAYRGFAAAAGKNVFEDTGKAESGFFVTQSNLATAALDAWAHSLAALLENEANTVLEPLTGQRLSELFGAQAKTAIASGDPADIAETLEALALLQATVLSDAGNAFENIDETALQQQLESLRAAFLARIRDTDREITFDQTTRITRAFLEFEALRTQAGLDGFNTCMAEVGSFLEAYGNRYYTEVGFLVAAPDPEDSSQVIFRQPGPGDPEPRYKSLNRFELLFIAKRLIEIESQKYALGFEGTSALAEVSDFLDIARERINADLEIAKQTNNRNAVLFAVKDLLDIEAAAQAVGSENSSLSEVLETLEAFPPPTGNSNARDFLVEARFVVGILEQIPNSETARLFGSTHYTRLGTILDDLFESFPNNPAAGRDYNATELVEILELGLLRDRLYRSGNYGQARPNLNWTDPSAGSDSQLSRLISQLAIAAGATQESREARNWTAIEKAAELIFTESKRMEAEYISATDASVQTARNAARFKLLSHSTSLLDHYHFVALADWHAGAATLGTNAAFADLVLPGNIRIEKASGAVAFNVETGFFSGAFSGAAQLPKFDAMLTVPNGSFDTNGNIAFSAFGTTTFPAEGENLTLSITERHPLSIEIGPDQFPAIGGSGRLELPNGMYFEAFFDIDDPEYLFGAEAGGIHFEVAQNLTLTLPHVNTDQFDQATLETRAALNSYFSSLGATIAPLVDKATSLPSPNFTDIGQPPEFQAPSVSIPLSEVAAWGNSLSSNLADVLESGYATAVQNLKEPIESSTEALLEEIKAGRASLDNATKQLEFLQKSNAQLEALASSLKKEAAGQALGLSSNQDFLGKAQAEAAVIRDMAVENLRNTPVGTNSIPHISAAIRAATKAEATYQLLGGEGNSALSEILDASTPKFDSIQEKLLSKYGIDENGTVVDEEKYKNLSNAQRRFIAKSLLQIKGGLQLLGSEREEEFELTTVTNLLLLQFRDLYDESPERRENETPTQRIKRLFKATEIAAELMALGSEEEDLYGVGSDLFNTVDGLKASIASQRPELQGAALDAEVGAVISTVKREIEAEKKAEEREFKSLLAADNFFDRFIESAQRKKEAKHPVSQILDVINSYIDHSGSDLENDAMFVSLEAFLSRQLLILADADLSNQQLSELSAFSSESLGLLIAAIELAGNTADGFESSIDISVPTLQLQDWTIAFNEVAQARQAYWLTEQHLLALESALETYGDSLTEESREALENAQSLTLQASYAILSSLADVLDSFELQDHVLTLAGGIQIDRAFGQLAFNRVSGDWQFKLGGRLSFPDVDGYFEIVDSTFSRDNGFALQLKAGAPIPVEWGGQTVDLNVEGGFVLSGNWNGHIRDTEFAAEISFEEGGATNTYAAEVSYHYNADSDSHSFGIYAAATDTFSVFGNDLVVFHGGVGSDVTADESGVTAATLYSDARVGILNKISNRPDPYSPVPSDFQLLYQGKVVLGTKANGDVTIALRDGDLQLPEGFVSSACDGSSIADLDEDARARVSIDELAFEWIAADQALSFDGSIAYSNVRFAIEGFEELWVDACDMRLDLSFAFSNGSQIAAAALRDVNAIINIPLLDGEYVRAELDQGAWSIGGFPTFELSLVNDLTLFDFEPLSLKLLGQNDLGQAQSSIALNEDEGERSIVITGFASASVEGMFTNAADEPVDLNAGTSSVLTISIPNDGSPPSFEDIDWQVDAIEMGADGELYMGSAGQGLFVLDPRLRLENPLGIFASQFELVFDFGLGVALSDDSGATGETVSLSTTGSRIVFNQELGSPFFFPGKSCYSYGDSPGDDAESQSLLGEGELPLMIRQLCIDFRSPSTDSGYFSLYPNDGAPFAVFDPSNIAVTLSADLNIEDIVTGSVDNLEMQFVDGKPTASVNGLGFGVDLTETIGFPVSGTVYIGGLQHFPQIFFSGKLTAIVKGYAIDGIGAFDAQGFRGLCFGLAGSEISIPLPYGFTLNGAQGGLALGSYVVDPCDFKSVFPIDPNTGKPLSSSTAPDWPLPDVSACSLLTWEELVALRETNVDTAETQALAELTVKRYRFERLLVLEFNMSSQDASAALEGLSSAEMDQLLADLKEDVAESESGNPVDEFTLCPDPGNCPPAALGIAAQPHPEAFIAGSEYEGRTIFKFTSIDETTLNAFGITPEFVAGFVGSASADQLAAQFAHQIVSGVGSIIPRLPDDFPDPEVANTINQGIEDTLQQIELGFANTLVCAIDAAGAPDDAAEVYIAIAEAAYAGVPYEDVTIKVTGEFSYIGVNSFASVSGGMIQSTSGSAGLVGDIKLFGVPVGGAELYLNRTDEYGNLAAPNLCGKINAKLGPLELGNAAFLFDCPGCVEKTFNAVENFASSLSAQYVYDVMRNMQDDFPDLNASPAYGPLDHFNQLDSDDKRQAFLSRMVAAPPVDSFGNYSAAYIAFSVELANAIVPRLAACGAVQPKLFGFGLAGGNDMYSFKSYAGPIDTDDISAGVTLIESFTFSPSNLIGQALLSGTGSLAAFSPAFDNATANLRFNLPAPGDLLYDSYTKDKVTFADERLRDLLGNAVSTFEYQLAPWGLELGRAGGRILMPSFDHHPRSDSSYFVGSKKTSYDAQLRRQGLPSRLEVLLATMGDDAGSDLPNYLADPTWSGRGSDAFNLVFAGSEYEGQFDDDINLTDHFFPHGGLVGASSLALPKLITDGLPASAGALLEQGRSLPEYAADAQELFTYLFETTEVGELAFYIPAPNPPVSTFPNSTEALIDQISNFDPQENFSQFYPAQQAFMQGWTNTPILGIPTTTSTIALNGDNGTFDIAAQIPSGSWFHRFLGQSQLTLSVASGENVDNPISTTFWNTYAELRNLVSESEREQLVADFVTQIWDGTEEGLSELFDYARLLPKVSAKLSGKDLRLPNPVALDSNLATIESAQFEVYSPYFNQAGATGNGAIDRIRREGGIGFIGDLTIGDGIIEIPNAEFSISPNPSGPLAPPTVASTFELSSISLGTLFDPSTPNSIYQGDFLISPEQGRLLLSTRTPHITIPPLGYLLPLPGDKDGRIRSELSLIANYEEERWEDFTLSIDPGEIDSPFLSDTLHLYLHGENEKDPFTYSQTQPWTASAHFEGTGGIDLGPSESETWILIEPKDANWTDTASITVSNTGISISNLPIGTKLSFPDNPIPQLRGQSVEANASGTISINIAEDDFEIVATIDNPLSFGGLFPIESGFTITATPDSFAIDGTVKTLALGPINVEPLSGTDLDIALRYAPSGSFLEIEAAKLDLDSVGVQQELRIHGKSTDDPFRIATSGPWEANVTLDELTLDPDGNGNLFNPILHVEPASSSSALLQTEISSNGFARPNLEVTREGAIDVTWYPGQGAREVTLQDVDPGSLRFRLNDSGFDLTASNAADFFQFDNIPAFAITGSLRTSSEGFTASINSANAFRFPTSANPPLLSIGAASGGTISADSDGFRLEIDPPDVSLLGIPIVSEKISEIEFLLGGTKNDLSINLTTTDDVGLFGTDILELKAGTHRFSGNLDFKNSSRLAVDLGARMNIRYPNPNNLSQTLLRSINLDLAFDTDGEMAPLTFSSNLPEFDLGWLELDKGDITIDYERTQVGRQTFGNFTLAAAGWDLELFGTRFNNLGASVSTAGEFTASAGGSSTELDLGAIVFDLAEAMPFAWNMKTGALELRLPTTTRLQLPDLFNVGGTFESGLDLPTIDIGADGTFDLDFTRSLTIGEGSNAFSLASVDLNLRRSSSGLTTFEFDHTLGYELGPNMKYYLRARSNNTFTNRISGQLALPVGIGEAFFALSAFDGLDGTTDGKLTFATAELYLDANSTAPTYSGTVNLGGTQFALSISSRQSDSFIKVGPIELPLPTL